MGIERIAKVKPKQWQRALQSIKAADGAALMASGGGPLIEAKYYQSTGNTALQNVAEADRAVVMAPGGGPASEPEAGTDHCGGEEVQDPGHY